MFRLGCLDDKETFSFSSSASSPELFQKLQSLFVGPEVLHSKQSVSGYDGHKAQVAEVESLGHDLGAYEYVDLSVGESFYGLGFVCLVLGCIAVKTGYAGIRE